MLFRSVFLAVIVFFSSLTLITSNAETTYAAEVPGTQAYYDARWEESKIQVGWLATNGTTITNPGPWKMDTGLPVWNGNVAGTASTATVNGGTYNASTNPYKVTTPEQFRWCIVNRMSFKLQNNINLGGYLGRDWGMPAPSTNTWIADGNGFTVYNYYMSATVVHQSMFGRASNVTIQNLRISNSYGYFNGSTSANTGAMLIAGATNTKIFNCVMENNSIYSDVAWVVAFFSSRSIDSIIDNSYTDNCHIYVSCISDSSCCAQIDCASRNTTITNTFVINGTVIGNKGHNGGFMSCNRGGLVKNCFSDIDVYGNRDAGGFIGVLHPGSIVVEDCFGIGKVEGTNGLGGFIGASEAKESSSVDADFKRCYSAVMVGMMSNAERQGSFMGTYDGVVEENTIGTSTYMFTDCYAVGEVGSLSVNTALNRGNDKIGGFTGEHEGKFQYKNCYYDKQTTAMKEWALGHPTTGSGWTSDTLQNGSYAIYDIKGVLTTNSGSNGKGLTGNPTVGSNNASDGTNNRSFTGFTDNSQWVFEEGYYPQLKVFAQPTTFTNTNWMSQTELNDLVKAYSKASVSTVYLNTWEKDFAGNALSKDTYDTVRDLTTRFPMTSASNISWATVGNGPTLSNGTGNESNVYGQVRNVLELIQKGSQYTVEDFAPGIEWLRVNATVGNKVGTKALRICPTANITAGYSQAVIAGQTYDHANDMRMAYSTGLRLSSNDTDYTYGVFPDDPLENGQSSLMTSSAYQPPEVGGLNGFCTENNDKFKNIPTGYMQKSGVTIPTPTTSAGCLLNEVRIQQVTNIDVNGVVSLGTALNMDNPSYRALFNGYTPFLSSQVGEKYVITYYWSLADGRYLQGGKMINLSDGDAHKVSIEAQVPDGTRNSNYAYLDAYDISKADGSVDSSKVPQFGTTAKGYDEIAAQAITMPAATAWKPYLDTWEVDKVNITFTPDDTDLTPASITFTKSELPATGGSITFSVNVPYIAIKLNSSNEYETYLSSIKKTYTMTKDASGVYIVKFAGTFTDGNYGAKATDVSEDIHVIVVLTPPTNVNLSIATPNSVKYTGLDRSDSDFDNTTHASVLAGTGMPDGSTVYSTIAKNYGVAADTAYMPYSGYELKNLYITETGSTTKQIYLGSDGYIYTDVAYTTKLTVLADDTTGWTGFTNENVKWKEETVMGETYIVFELPKTAQNIHIDVDMKSSIRTIHIRQVVVNSNQIAEQVMLGYMKLNNVAVGTPGTAASVNNIVTLSGKDSETPPFSDFKLAVNSTYNGYTVEIGRASCRERV